MTRTAPSRCDVTLATVCCLVLWATHARAGEFGRFFQDLAAPLRAAQREPPVPRHPPVECGDSIERSNASASCSLRLVADSDRVGRRVRAFTGGLAPL